MYNTYIYIYIISNNSNNSNSNSNGNSNSNSLAPHLVGRDRRRGGELQRRERLM